MRRLRAECAWKASQTHRSLARYLLEEVHETLEALDLGDTALLREELGDLLLQVVFHAAIAEQAGDFTFDDVAADLVAKLVRRNPHVFAAGRDPGDVPADPAQVNELWESVKATEKQRTTLTEGLPPGLPALLHADKVLDRLARRDGVAVGALGEPGAVGEPDPDRPVLVLVPSPLLGPATWQPVGWWLRGRGHDVVVAGPPRAPVSPQAVEDSVVEAAAGRPVILVVHSNAGLHAPHLTTLLDVRAVVYVDAALAGTDTEETALAPPALVEQLEARVDTEGLLPRWTDWWPAEATEGLFPDPATRAGVEAEQRAVPVDYLRARVPVPPGWQTAPAAYLAFGSTYAEETAQARRSGWPVELLPGEHLHAVVDPAAVAGAVERLVARLVEDLHPSSDAVGARLLGAVAQAHEAGVDPEQALRDATRRLLAVRGSATSPGGR